MMASWQFWALMSAVFAALTAIFAKIGIQGINSDFATLVRTLVIIGALCLFLTITGQWQRPGDISARSWLFLVLSGLATGASWLAYFRALQIGDAARVAPSTSFRWCWWPCLVQHFSASACLPSTGLALC